MDVVRSRVVRSRVVRSRVVRSRVGRSRVVRSRVGRSRVVPCPITLTFGKDVASIIYRHLYQLHMTDVNTQFLQYLEICDEHNTICFGSATSVVQPPYPHSNHYLFGVNDCIWFNFRGDNAYSRTEISAYFHDDSGWHVRQPIK